MTAQRPRNRTSRRTKTPRAIGALEQLIVRYTDGELVRYTTNEIMRYDRP